MAASKVGGYEHSFLEQPSTLKEFECPVCLCVTREPSLTSCCGQHFCQSCISRITTDRKPCPFCKKKFFTVFLDKKQKRKVLDLKVSCTMKEQGCTWTGELGDFDAHTDSDVQNNGGCQYVDVICSNKCGKSFQRQYLRAHLFSHCPNRRFICIYCNYQDSYVNIHNEHYSKCPKYLISCPNECNIVKVQRCLMTKHLKECPKQLVECEFAHAGCTGFRRQDLEKHAEQSTQSHLSMVSSKLQEGGKEMKVLMTRLTQEVIKLQTRLDEKDKEVRALTTRLDEKDKEVRALTTRLDEKDKEVRALTTRLDEKDKAVLKKLQTKLSEAKEARRGVTFTSPRDRQKRYDQQRWEDDPFY